jgi:purine-binding chemotaxis protein CheW
LPDTQSEPVAAASRELLSFAVAGTEFAFDVDCLCEVVELVEIMRVQSQRQSADGIINYRGTVIPVVDTRRVLGFGRTGLDADARIIVTDVGAEKTGLIVDRVHDVLAVPQSAVDQPAARMPLGRFVSGIAKLEGRLLLILDIAELLGEAGAEAAAAHSTGAPALGAVTPEVEQLLRDRAMELSRPVEQPDGAGDEVVTTVCFRLSEGAYAIRADYAKEIVTPPTITPIPCAPSYVLGAVNIRGAIVPVLVLADFLGLETALATSGEDARIIVVESRGVTVGLFVTEVLGIYEVATSDMTEPMDAIEAAAMSFIEAEFDRNGRVYCTVDAAAIFRTLEEHEGAHGPSPGRAQPAPERIEGERGT